MTAESPDSSISRRKFLKDCACNICTASGAALFIASQAEAGQTAASRGLLGPRRSPWFKKAGDKMLQCTLCPRSCHIPEGKRGFCRVRGNHRGKGFTLVYGNPAIVQIDPIERKPFYHVLPASQSLSVATAGCSVSCKFCEVWDLALVAPDDVYAYNLSPEQTVDQALQGNVKSVSFTYGEPVIFFEYMLDTAKAAKKAGLKALVHTNGYITKEPLDELCMVIDGANIDLKAFDESFYKEIVGGELGPVLETLGRIRAAGKHIEITNMIIPGLNDGSRDIDRMCKWIKKELGDDTPIHFNRFYPLYRLSNLEPTPVSTLDRARKIAMENGLLFAYIGNIMGHHGQHTVCPDCGNEVIHRVGFMIEEPELNGGRCKKCGCEIPGIWSL